MRHSLLILGLASVACSPGDARECTSSIPCEARGHQCDVATSTCVEVEVDRSSTESPAAASFSAKAMAIHRGEVCLPHEVLAGAAFPIALRPCVHPCVTVADFAFQHSWSCENGACEGWLVGWMTGSGQECPEDAFGRFDRDRCTYPIELETTMTLRYTDDLPVEGELELEIPFLTNADAATIVEASGREQVIATIETAIYQYPRDPERIAGGRAISLHPMHSAPPSDCQAEGACSCYEFGFAQ